MESGILDERNPYCPNFVSGKFILQVTEYDYAAKLAAECDEESFIALGGQSNFQAGQDDISIFRLIENYKRSSVGLNCSWYGECFTSSCIAPEKRF
jgi:hypothetical protein